jgi:glycosyltransferase involved in cell wall biosynthesis
MNRQTPLVSVITPTYNSESTIKETYKSLLKQTYTNWEWLVTDDCSQDSTLSLLDEIKRNDKRVNIQSNIINSGAGVSRNKSIERASGRFIAFLDSDDLWKESKLEKQISFMLKNGYALTYTYYTKIDTYGNLNKTICAPKKVSYRELLKSNVIGCLTAVYDTNLVGKVYMPTIRKRQDMALWLRILNKIDYAYCIDEELAFYREGHASLSSNKGKILLSQWSFYREYLDFNILKTFYYFSFYVVRALKKHR